MCENQNFVLSSNTDLEIVCRFLFESSEIIFEKLVWPEIFPYIFVLFRTFILTTESDDF